MIKIYTKLSESIYASNGGGEIREQYTYKTTGRNLLLAIKKLGQHRAYMSECYGNIGCGASWLEIDGKKLTQEDKWELEDIIEGRSLEQGSKTQQCERFLRRS